MTRREFVHRHNNRQLIVVPQQLLPQRVLVLRVVVARALLHVQYSSLLLQALLLEEQPDVVDGKDDALAVRLLRIYVDAPDQHRVGAVEQGKQQNRHTMRQ